MAKKKRRTKKRKPETPMERLKAVPLWTWGAIVIMAGVFSNLTNQMMIDAQNLTGAAARGAKFGGAVAALVFITVGVVLIIIHLVRARK